MLFLTDETGAIEDTKNYIFLLKFRETENWNCSNVRKGKKRSLGCKALNPKHIKKYCCFEELLIFHVANIFHAFHETASFIIHVVIYPEYFDDFYGLK